MKKFTLIEMMMVLAIIAILFGIGTAVFSKAVGASEQAKVTSELQILVDSFEKYHIRFGSTFPMHIERDPGDIPTGQLAMTHKFSKVAYNANWEGKRPMFVKFIEVGFDTEPGYDESNLNDNYRHILYDPWGDPYYYFTASTITRTTTVTNPDGTKEDVTEQIDIGVEHFILLSAGGSDYEGAERDSYEEIYCELKEDNDTGEYYWEITGAWDEIDEDGNKTRHTEDLTDAEFNLRQGQY